MVECSVEECCLKHYGHGYCNKHYRRWKRNGSIETTFREREETPRSQKELNLWSYYRLSLDAFETLLARQDGKCAICRKEYDKWEVDHDHSCCPSHKSCGACVRGILCRGCNSGIAFFGDDVETMRSAIAYLQGL